MEVKEKKLKRAQILERGWEALVNELGPERAQEFVMTFPREDEDSVSYWKNFWGEKSVDEIYQTVQKSG